MQSTLQGTSRYLEVSVNDVLLVQILNCEEHLSCIESGTLLWKPVITALPNTTMPHTQAPYLYGSQVKN